MAVPADVTLGELHEVIQIAMGWSDSHLHRFVLRDRSLEPDPDEAARQLRKQPWDRQFLDRLKGQRVFVRQFSQWGEPTELEGEDEDAVALAEVCPKLKSKLAYEYDFGDGWEHTIRVQKILEAEPGTEYPVCLAGKKACPPEDCGGVWGYYELLDAVQDASNEQREELSEWLGDDFDPHAFDSGEVNAMLAAWRQR